MNKAEILAALLAGAVSAAAAAAPKAAPSPAPAQYAARVGTNILSVVEASARGKMLLDDERKFNMLSYTPDKQSEAEAHYRSAAVERWVCNKILADEARRRGYKASPAEIRAQIAKMDATLRARRNTTAAEFIKNCPFGESTLRKDIENAVIIDKMLAADVMAKIPVSDAEIQAAIAAAKAANAKAKPGARKIPETQAAAIAIARRKKFRAAFRSWYEELKAKADVEIAGSTEK